ncbi:hypothetical protein PCANC_14734 [Puccinia coronata f. sp. avenae]|uniref:Uncharacterized protein n=1 Tax=Puccinia coronata f. sp. avenae TaxID=200324 RepID=A0A2N5SXV8_9BASI|nr:hypothetical protein PCANC_14734 [Puccinia coronata f. sp. avenae]
MQVNLLAEMEPVSNYHLSGSNHLSRPHSNKASSFSSKTSSSSSPSSKPSSPSSEPSSKTQLLQLQTQLTQLQTQLIQLLIPKTGRKGGYVGNPTLDPLRRP